MLWWYVLCKHCYHLEDPYFTFLKPANPASMYAPLVYFPAFACMYTELGFDVTLPSNSAVKLYIFSM